MALWCWANNKGIAQNNFFFSQGYEYFGYDPLTYYSNESSGEEGGSFHLEDTREEELEIEEFDEEEKQREPVLEIDLDEVENCKAEVRQGKDQGRDILCKWSSKKWNMEVVLKIVEKTSAMKGLWGGWSDHETKKCDEILVTEKYPGGITAI